MNAFLIILAIAMIIGFFCAIPKILDNRKSIAATAKEQCGMDLSWMQKRSAGTIAIMVMGIALMSGCLALGLYIGFYYTVGVASIYITIFSFVLAIEVANYIFAGKYSNQVQNVYAAA
jgi:cadmium resistance protein CadD (predicted permease)